MNYKLVDIESMPSEGGETSITWDLIEVSTGLKIGNFLKKDDAKSMLRHMNMGGAFDGFTPDFFCKKIGEL
jgi:hypothetical protein